MDVRVKLLEHFPRDLVDEARYLRPAHQGDAGYDIVSAEDVWILPGEQVLIATGIAVELPPPQDLLLEGVSFETDNGITALDTTITDVRVAEMQLRPGSGNALKLRISIPNTPATVDSTYRGEVKVILANEHPVITAEEWLHILDALNSDLRAVRTAVRERIRDHLAERIIQVRRGDRIAQAVFAWVIRPRIRFVAELGQSVRGSGGFGSTGLGGSGGRYIGGVG